MYKQQIWHRIRALMILLVAILLISACTTAAEPETIVETVVVTEIVEGETVTIIETVEVEVPVTVEPETPQEAGPSGQLTISETSDINTVDPKFLKGRHAQNVVRLMFDSLYHRDDNMQIIPWLATSIENPDELTWRFHLREGVKFHNGNDFQAQIRLGGKLA